MKISHNRSTEFFYVDWWLMNHNSRMPSYEHDLLHCGNIDLPYLKDCQRFVDQAQAAAQKKNKKALISFTGGEVTEWVDFVDLMAYTKQQNCFTRFITNASADAAYLENIFQYTDSVIIEVHPEFASISHILYILNKLSETQIGVSVNINMIPEKWDELTELYDKIYQKYSNIMIYKKMLFYDPIFNSYPQAYKDEQFEILKTQWRNLKIEKDGQEEITNFYSMILEQKNRFQGMNCWAGLEQIVVDAWGRVYRSHCRKNGFMGYIKDPELVWYDQPMICDLEACVNGFDVQATKQSLE
jgi:MoaA/NifB/PqqE/SkfB family radical SAM enzyme